MWLAVHKQSCWLFSVTSVSGVEIMNKSCVWYSQNILPMIKMLNQNMTQRGTQATGISDVIVRRSPDSQHGWIEWHPANVGCSFVKNTNNDLRSHTYQRHKRKAWTREDIQYALHCYFRNNPTQRGYRKRMIEIWQNLLVFRQKENLQNSRQRCPSWPQNKTERKWKEG